jgi:hypothetical protein
MADKWTAVDAKELKVKVPINGELKEFITDEPYVHWFHRLNEEFGIDEVFDGRVEFKDLGTTRVSERDSGKIAKNVGKSTFGSGVLVPLPPGCANRKTSIWDPKDVADAMPYVDDDTVIVGIVDTGISPGHRRFRDTEGHTRFLAAWQQGAQHLSTFNASCKPSHLTSIKQAQAHLPCGQEIYGQQIQDAIASHSYGDQDWLDEDAFNRELELVDPGDPLGQRDLDFHAAHGTHVLDLATGMNPSDLGASEAMRRQKIIAVNLPAQYAHGTAGNFLAYFAIFALERIIFLSDALWRKNHNGEDGSGYPIVVNFSYGMQAGPKDGSQLFEKRMTEIVEARKRAGKSPLRIAMPAGNENLNRGHATAVLGPKGSRAPGTGYRAEPKLSVPWRIQPSDGTPNYLEIWSQAYPKEVDRKEVLNALQLAITPPGSDPLKLPKLKPGKFYNLGLEARLYCLDHMTDQGWRLRLLLCVAPTTHDNPKWPIARAGAWDINIQYTGPVGDFDFYVQSDQSGVRSSKTGRRPYLDHKYYETHVLRKGKEYQEDIAAYGGVRDSYHYDLKAGSNDAEYWPDYGPVMRRGTVNALASQMNDSLVCIGGFDDSSGKPALYSGSTDGNPSDKGLQRSAISASYPSENASSLFGLLAAGGRDGSTVPYSGTSMATAFATREIADAFCRHSGKKGLGRIGTERWLRDLAEEREEAIRKGKTRDHWGERQYWSFRRILKAGVGRLPTPESYAESRTHRLRGG